MERVLVLGASGGIGSAISAALQDRGVAVSELSRSRDGLDVTDEASVEAALSGLSPIYDGIIVATGALEIAGASPEKSIRAVTAQSMLDQFALNAVGPALVLKYALRLLPKDRRSVLAVLSARVGSIGDNAIGGWVSYRAAKAAVNQVVRTAAIELARSHPKAICVSLHPGTVRSPLTQKYLARYPSVTPEVAAGHLLDVIEGLLPSDSGGFFDWAGKPVPW